MSLGTLRAKTQEVPLELREADLERLHGLLHFHEEEGPLPRSDHELGHVPRIQVAAELARRDRGHEVLLEQTLHVREEALIALSQAFVDVAHLEREVPGDAAGAGTLPAVKLCNTNNLH